MALFVVFLVVASATLIATSLAVLGRAETRSADTARHRAQARALAWSGVQAVMAELDAQRDVMLSGGTPELLDAWSLYGTETERGMIRLIPIDPDRDALLVSESAKLDLNQVDADTLGRLPGMTPDLAQRVISARQALAGGRFQSLGDLLSIEGVTPELLWGPPAEWQVQSVAVDPDDDRGRLSSRLASMQRDLDAANVNRSIARARTAPASEEEGDADAGPTETPLPGDVFGNEALSLSDLLTVFNYEPAIQMSGRYRINFNAEFTPQMRSRIERRYGSELADFIEQARANGLTLTDDELFTGITDVGEPSEWDQYVDGFCTSDAPFYHGRPDINRAPVAVIAALPGVLPDQAAQIATVRDSLSDVDREGLAWLVQEGILDSDQWARLAPRITWRSFVWRVRVMGQVLQGGADEPTRETAHTVLEAVIDLSSPTPRIAYLRDITMLEPAGALFGSGALDVNDDLRIAEANSFRSASGSDAEGSAPGGNRPPGPWAGSDDGGAYDASPDDPPGSTDSRDPDEEDDDDRSADRGNRDDEEEVEAEDGAGADADGDADDPDSGSSSPSTPHVRPLGRWTSGR